MRLLPRDDRVAQNADPLDLGLDDVAGLEVERGGSSLKPATPDTVPVREDVARASSRAGSSGRDLGHVADIRLMFEVCRTSPFTRSSIARSCGSPISSAVTIHGPSGQKVSIALQNEKTPPHLPALNVAGGDVVEDHVAGDVVHRLLRAEVLAVLPITTAELELVVELLGQVLGVDDRLVRADDRVDVLEEHDPGRDRVRPTDVRDSSWCSRKFPAVWKNFFGMIGACKETSASG